MEDFYSLFNNFQIDLHKNFIFYIPSFLGDHKQINSYLETLGTALSEEEVKEMRGAFLCLDSQIHLGILTSCTNLHLVLTEKRLMLSKHVFDLVALQKSQNLGGFTWLLKNYRIQLAFVSGTSKVLVDNYHDNFGMEASQFYNLLQYQHTILESHLSVLDAEFQDYFSLELPTSNSKNIPIKKLDDFILHDQREQIVQIIEKDFLHLKGKSLRYLIEFLKEKDLLIVNPVQTELFKSLQRFFGDNYIGKYQSIFDSKVFFEKDIKYQNAKSIFETKFFEFY